jgi:hypothetical protein
LSTVDANDPMFRHQPRQLRAIDGLVRPQAAVELTNASGRVEFEREEMPTCPRAPGKTRALVEITKSNRVAGGTGRRKPESPPVTKGRAI